MTKLATSRLTTSIASLRRKNRRRTRTLAGYTPPRSFAHGENMYANEQYDPLRLLLVTRVTSGWTIGSQGRSSAISFSTSATFLARSLGSAVLRASSNSETIAELL